MAQNIELKIKLEEFSVVTEILHQNNIKLETILRQRDIYYKNKNGLLKLRIYNGSGELIFYQRNEDDKDRVSNYHLLKVDPGYAEDFFSKLFEIEVEVIKERRLYLYKNTRIHLDEVDKLGSFLELETVVNTSLHEGKNEFSEVVQLLNLDLNKQIKTSYRTLLLEK